MKRVLSLCLTTLPDQKKAASIARLLIRKKLAACVNILPGCTSVYEWQEKIYEEKEVLLLIKTQPKMVKKLQQELFEVHPYEVPEFIVFKTDDVAPNYFSWAKKSTHFGR